MGDHIRVNAGFYSEKMASKEVDLGTSAAPDLVHFPRHLPQHLNANGVPQDISATAPLPVQKVTAGSTLISRFLDVNGNGTGTVNANGDYSAAAESFFILPNAGTTYWLARLLICIEDDGTLAAGVYGALEAALPNGLILQMSNASQTLLDFTHGLPIQKNGDWGRFCDDVQLSAWETGNKYITARWTFAQGGRVLRLRGDSAEKLEVVVNDNLTGLVGHHFMVQGYVG